MPSWAMPDYWAAAGPTDEALEVGFRATAAARVGSVLRLIRRIAVGKRLLDADQLDRADPRLSGSLLVQQGRAMAAFWLFVFAAAIFAAAAAWMVASKGTAAAELAAGAAFGMFGLSGGRWLAERDDRAAQEERIVTLGSVFYQSPQVLRDLLQPERIDDFLRNLLKTVLRDDELGKSVWGQGVSPLVDAISRGNYRQQMRYDIRLAPLRTSVELPLSGCPSVSPASSQLLVSELGYQRLAKSIPAQVYLGLIFEPGRGLSWFEQTKFVLREYAPFDAAVLKALGGVKGPSALRSGPLGPIGKAAEQLRAPRRRQLLQLAELLCQPRLEVGGMELSATRVGLDRQDDKATGLAVGFPVPRSLRRRFDSDQVVDIRARLTVPVPKNLASFPVHLSELTRGAEVLFDYAQAGIDQVETDMFFAGRQPFRTNWVRTRPGYQVVSSEPSEWLFRGSGMVFSWRPDAPAEIGP